MPEWRLNKKPTSREPKGNGKSTAEETPVVRPLPTTAQVAGQEDKTNLHQLRADIHRQLLERLNLSNLDKMDRAEVNRRLKAAGSYATSLPAATDQVGVVGYFWGGSSSFLLATDWADLDAAVVYYGSSPATETLSAIQAPVLGLYGGNDNRVNATIPDASTEMERLGKRYEVEIYDGAGHGFLRNQPGQEGANLRATEQAWPRTVAFFRELLEQ